MNLFKNITQLFIFSQLILLPYVSFSQKFEWERTFGGNKNEYLFDFCPTVDNGFILGGSSLSHATGNMTEGSNKSLDFYIWKLNKNGENEWQYNYGGDKDDILISFQKTDDSGYILGGYSNSENKGFADSFFGQNDIWIIKIDAKGIIEWQKVFGGEKDDRIVKVVNTNDGFIILATSNSNAGKFKKESSLGGNDLWIIKLDKKGKIIWEKTYGGNAEDIPVDLVIKNNVITIAGYTNSKLFNTNLFNSNNFSKSVWLIQLDNGGNFLRDKLLSGNGNNIPVKLLDNNDDFLLFGYSNSSEGEIKVESSIGYDYYMLHLTSSLSTKAIYSFDSENHDFLTTASVVNNDKVLLGGYTINKESKKNYFIVETDLKGTEISKKVWNSPGNEMLRNILVLKNGDYVFSGNSDAKKSKYKSQHKGFNDFWIAKIGKQEEPSNNIEKLEAIPNPTEGYTNIVINHSYKEGTLSVYDINGRRLHNEKIKYDMIPVNLSAYSHGIYIVEVKTDVKTTSVKVIKK